MTQFLYIHADAEHLSPPRGYIAIPARDRAEAGRLDAAFGYTGQAWLELATHDGAALEALFDNNFQFPDGTDPMGATLIDIIDRLAGAARAIALFYSNWDEEFEIIRPFDAFRSRILEAQHNCPVAFHIGWKRA